jgi:F-type H+-transporting ATPase subunit b
MLLSLDGTFLVQILNFIVFWALLNYVFIRPTRRAIEERQRFVARQREEADRFATEAKAMQAQAEAILDEARRSTDETMRAAASHVSDEAHAIDRTASEEAAGTIALAHATVASERAAAIAKQGPFVDELAHTMAQRALGVERVA